MQVVTIPAKPDNDIARAWLRHGAALSILVLLTLIAFRQALSAATTSTGPGRWRRRRARLAPTNPVPSGEQHAFPVDLRVATLVYHPVVDKTLR